MPDNTALIESVAGDNEQLRTLLYSFNDQLTQLGSASVTPGTQKPTTTPPPIGSISVSGANGVYSVNITNPTPPIKTAVLNQVQYSTVKNFSQNVTTMQTSAATSFSVPAPGQTLFFQYRSSYDGSTWNAWTTAGTASVSSNLQSSAASENNVVLGQSNYGYVDSVAGSSAADIRVYGAAGPYNGWVSQKETVETQMPSATIVNATFGSTKFVAFNGEEYEAQATLPQVFADGNTLVGKVSVVGAGSPTLPTLTPIVQNGYVIAIAFNPAGAGLTQAPDITISSSGAGAGAEAVATIEGGVVTGIQVTNPGNGSYVQGTTTAAATGGVFQGASGGGQAAGGNGGRLTAV